MKKSGWTRVKSPRSAETSVDTSVATAVASSPPPQSSKLFGNRGSRPEPAVIPQSLAVPLDPVATVTGFRQGLVERLKGLGTRPAHYAKALAEINAILAEDYYRGLKSDAMTALRVLLPKITQMPVKKEPANQGAESPVMSFDDTQSAEKRSSGEQRDGSQPTSTPASSPDKDKSDLPSPLDSSPEAPARIKYATQINNSNNDEVPPTAPSLESLTEVPSAPPIAHVAEMLVGSQYAELLVSEGIVLVPVCDLFNAITTQHIFEENALNLKHPLLEPLHEVIFRLQRLKGDFKNSERLLSPITRLCDYYMQAREQLVNAQSAAERQAILTPEAYAVGDARDYFIIDPGKFATSGEKARNILSRTKEGKIDKEEGSPGNRAGGVHNGAYLKSNPVGGNYLQPATEIAVSTWYQLFCRLLVSAPSANLKVMHAPVTLPENPDDRIKPMLRNFNDHDYIERVVQCGYLVDGIDFDIVLYILTIVNKWQAAIPQEELKQYLAALIKSNDQDLQQWPEALKKHSGLQEKDYHRLTKYIAAMRKLVPNITPENLLKTCNNLLNEIDLYSFSSLIISNLAIRPSDLKGDNVKLMWDTLPDGSRKYRIVCIDSDQALEFPTSKAANGQHFPNIKCLLFLMREHMEKPIDPVFRQEFLSRSPQMWILHWCQFLYQDDKRNRELIAEQAYRAEDLYETKGNDVTVDPDAELKRMRRMQAEAPTKAHTLTREYQENEALLMQSLDIPFLLHPALLPEMLRTLECLQQAMIAKPNLSLMECLRIARPETAIYYEKVCAPHVVDNDPSSLLEAYMRVHFQSASFEKFFLKDKVEELVKQHDGANYNPKSDSWARYSKLLADQKQPNFQGANRLPSLEELSKEVVFQELNGKSLYDLLKNQTHAAHEHREKATLRVEDAIKLFVNGLDFNQYIPKKIPELLRILDEVGTHFPFLTVSRFHEAERNELISLAAEAALPGAVTLLSKSFADMNSRNKLGETPLHVLMRLHKNYQPEKVLATLEACLRVSTCESGLFNKDHLTPLMVLIANARPNDIAFTEQFIKAFRLGKANIDQRTQFPNQSEMTALDYAIKLKNPAACIALLNQGASDLANTAAAVEFALVFKHDNAVKTAIDLLQKRNWRFAYEYAIARMSTAVPDIDHPKHCMMDGAQHGVRYLHKDVWSQMFNEKGELNRPNGVAAGTHVVIPVKFEGETLTFCKAFPELPGTQFAVDVLHSECGSLGSPYSELWRCETANGKKIFPLQMNNAIRGIPLNIVLKDPQLSKDLLSKLDPYYLTMLVFIENLIGQEDGHAAQYMVVTIPMPEGERTILVMVDGDHAFVPAFNPYLPGKNKLYIKDIIFLLDQVAKKGMDPRAIESIIKMNAERILDRWSQRLSAVEDAHFRLFPRGEENFTMTAPEAMRNPGFARSMLSGVKERLNDKVVQQRDKLLTDEEKAVAPARGGRLVQAVRQKAKQVLKIQGDYSIIGVSFEQNAIAKLHERFCQTQKVLSRKAIADAFNGMMLLQFTRPALYRAYNAIMLAHPNLTPYEKFEKLTEGLYKHLGKDAEPVTCSSNFDIMVSQEVSAKHQSTGSWITIKAAIQVYNKSKELEAAKDSAIAQISSGDTTKLQAFPRDDQKEYIVNRLRWERKNSDNRAIIKTIIQQEISFTELRLINCLALTLGDIEDLLKSSPNLEILNLTGCSGVSGDIFKLLTKYCPDVRVVILSKTEISEADAADLPALTRCELSSCLKLKAVRLHAPNLKLLRLTGCAQLESLKLSEQTRGLEALYIEDCSQLKAKHIEAVLEYSPSLAKIRHKNNEPFFARAFACYALEQGRYDKNIFLGLLQHGKLNLYGLKFNNAQLKEMQEWLTKPGSKLAINEVDFRGTCFVNRIAVTEFLMKVPVTKAIVPSPWREEAEVIDNPFPNGLKGNIVAWHELPSGAIWSAAERVMINPRKPGAVSYTVRMPDLEGTNDPMQCDRDKFKGIVHYLLEGADIHGSDVMTDGTLLLSMEIDSSQGKDAYLLHLDPLTNEKSFLEVPEVISRAGKICVLNNTTFALHSDRFYIIQKGQFGWNVLHSAPGPVGKMPILKGPDGLVVYSVNEGENSTLSVMDIETGTCVCSHQFESTVVKPLHFFDRDRLFIFIGTAFVTLNIKNYKLESHKFDNNEDLQSQIDHLGYTASEWFHATSGPLGELVMIGSLHCDARNPNTFSRNGGCGSHQVVGNPLICYQGDVIYNHETSNTFYLKRTFNKYHVIDLSFRNKIKAGYRIDIGRDGDDSLRILTPEKIIPPSLDIFFKDHSIDLEKYHSWLKTMISGQFTGSTLYEMISALFESYAAPSEEFHDKRKVTYEGKNIIIKDLSALELRVLNSLLESFLSIQPSISLAALPQRFNYSGTQSGSDNRRRNSLVTITDDSDASEEADELKY